jgi:hypothetical protein
MRIIIQMVYPPYPHVDLSLLLEVGGAVEGVHPPRVVLVHPARQARVWAH